MSSKKKRTPKYSPQIPMLVLRGLVNDDLELRERMSVEAFAQGFANEQHSNTLADMQGSMLIAATVKKEYASTVAYAKDTVGPVLRSIVKRYQATGKFGCNGDELKILRAFVAKHREFWLRQPVGLYQEAYVQMKAAQDRLRKQQVAE